jgi:hypothetical protein
MCDSRLLSTNYTDNCVDGVGGNYDFVYLQAFDFFSAQTVSATNIITALTMSGTSKVITLKTLKNGVKWSSKPNPAPEDGTLTFNQTLSVKCKGVTTTLRNILNDIGSNAIVAFVPRRDGTYWQLGGGYINSTTPTGGGLFLTPDSIMDSGESPAKYAGVTFGFAGEEYTNCREVTSAVITALPKY